MGPQFEDSTNRLQMSTFLITKTVPRRRHKQPKWNHSYLPFRSSMSSTLNILQFNGVTQIEDMNFRATSTQQQWVGHYGSLKWRAKVKKRELQFQKSNIRNEMAMKAATYSSKITTDIPLYESPGASFDAYLEDKPRVFKAMFPDKRRSKQLNQEEWRIEMLPINFLFLTVWPVVDMRLRCKSPPEIPSHITKVLELDITRWQLEGLDNVVDPSHFSLGVKGALYADRVGARTRLKGRLEMNISFVLPPVLALIPEDVRKNVAETVLMGLVQNMKNKVNGSLLADYSNFKRERLGKNKV